VKPSGPRLRIPFAGQVEVLAIFFERPRLATIEAEAQPENGCLAFVERCVQPVDLIDEQPFGRMVERRRGVDVGHHRTPLARVRNRVRPLARARGRKPCQSRSMRSWSESPRRRVT